MKYCTNCGASSPDNTRFCTNCGQAFPEDAPAAPEEQAAPEAVYAAPETAPAEVPAPGYDQQPAPQPFLPAEKPPKKKKTGLIVGLSVAAICLIGVIIAAVMLLTGTPKRAVEKGMDKTVKALQEVIGSTEDLEKAVKQFGALQEKNAMDVAGDFRVSTGGVTITASSSASYDGANKCASVSGFLEMNADGETLSFDLSAYADDSSMSIQIPRLLDRNLQIGTKTLGRDLLHLQDMGLFDMGLTASQADQISLDLFPDRDLSWLTSMQGEQQAHLKALTKSVEIDKPQTVTIQDQTLKAYAVRFDAEAAKQVVRDWKDGVLSAMAKQLESTTMMSDLTAEEALSQIESQFDDAISQVSDALDGFASGENTLELLLNQKGYLVGVRAGYDGEKIAFLLAGEENPWERILFVNGEGESEEVAASASLTSDGRAATLAFDEPTLSDGDYDSAYGYVSFPTISYESATGTFTVTGSDSVTVTLRIYTDEDDTVFSLGVEDEDGYDPMELEVKAIYRPLSAEPAPLSGETVQLGSASQDELIGLINELYGKLMSDPELSALFMGGY